MNTVRAKRFLILFFVPHTTVNSFQTRAGLDSWLSCTSPSGLCSSGSPARKPPGSGSEWAWPSHDTQTAPGFSSRLGRDWLGLYLAWSENSRAVVTIRDAHGWNVHCRSSCLPLNDHTCGGVVWYWAERSSVDSEHLPEKMHQCAKMEKGNF